MDNLTPTDLFSPSKARQQRAQAADWAQIESWLSCKFPGRPIPPFERNDDTLATLRALALANERADEDRLLQDRLERDASRECEERLAGQNEEDKKMLDTMTAYLSPAGLSSLHALAATAVGIEAVDARAETLAHVIMAHTRTVQNLGNQIAHIESLTAYLDAQHAQLRSQLSALQHDTAFQTPPNLPRQTSEMVRQTKHLRTKIREYEDRIAGLQYGQGRARSMSSSAARGAAEASNARALEEMLEQQMELDRVRERVAGLEARVEEFAGLPADREGARKEVGKLEVELDGWRRKRDALFGGLVA